MGSEPFDLEGARRNYRKRIETRRAERLARWERARDEADRAIRLITERYKPKRVIQWGSILRPERFTEISDIDIAVEGINDVETWSRMERELLGLVTFPLDLVPFEKIRPEHRSRILSRGKVVYERT